MTESLDTFCPFTNGNCERSCRLLNDPNVNKICSLSYGKKVDDKLSEVKTLLSEVLIELKNR